MDTKQNSAEKLLRTQLLSKTQPLPKTTADPGDVWERIKREWRQRIA